jgi:CRISPR system Cascade subunit CasC
MIGDVEFNSACYYKYFSVDVEGLVRNLTGESSFRTDVTEEERTRAIELARKAILALLKSTILTTPSGKQNSFAAHQLPAAVLVEVRPYRTPVSYANAFERPSRTTRDKDLVAASLDDLARHVEALTNGFNLEASARLLLAPEHPDYAIDGTTKVSDLNSLCAGLKDVIGRA